MEGSDSRTGVAVKNISRVWLILYDIFRKFRVLNRIEQRDAERGFWYFRILQRKSNFLSQENELLVLHQCTLPIGINYFTTCENRIMQKTKHEGRIGLG